MTGVKADNAVSVGRISATEKRILSSITGVTLSKGSEQAVSLQLL